jgi:hypothetical protein
MSLVAEPILKKQFRTITSKEVIKKRLKDDITKHLHENFINDTLTDLSAAFDAWNKEGGKKDKLKELIAQTVGKRKVFKFTQGTLDHMVDLLLSQSISLKVEKIKNPLDSQDFQDFLTYTLEDTARVLTQGLTDQPLYGVFFLHGNSRNLATPLIELSDKFLWVPSLPSEGELEDGTQLKRVDICRIFQPVIDEGFAGKKERGSVEVTGPRGGKFLCGEVYSSVNKADLKAKDKVIPLANDYSLELFVTKTNTPAPEPKVKKAKA